MIVGIGTDIVDIRRIQNIMDRYGDRFLERCFTDIEIEKAKSRKKTNLASETLAKRFAAKEACVKALGTGFINDIFLKDIGVTEDDKGRPAIHLTGGALRYLESLTPDGAKTTIHVSLADEPPYAQAFVIIEACFA